MPISVRLPPRVEQKLSDYCVSHKVTRSEAVKRALEHLFDRSGALSDAYKASAGFRGSDKTVGDVARHSKRLLRQRFRHRTSLG
ncbi:MAG: hypothetical protein WD775_10690 [Burkholderiales bacterium]